MSGYNPDVINEEKRRYGIPHNYPQKGNGGKDPPNRTTGILCRTIDIDAMMTHSAADERQPRIPCGTTDERRNALTEDIGN